MQVKTLGCCLVFSFLLVFCSSSVFCQKRISKGLLDSTKIREKQYKLIAKHSVDSARTAQKRKRDSISKKNDPDTLAFSKAFRFGFDFSKPVTSFLNKERKQIEFSVDYHLRTRTFLSAEGGYEYVSISHPGIYTYHSSGEYLRLGFDYSILRMERPYDNNIVFIGLRLAGANVNYKAQNISINEGYFGNSSAVLAPASSRAYWLEFIFGMKVEIIKRFSVGWTLRLASQFTDLTTKPTYPVFIPGFGNSSSTQNITYNYSVFYTF